MKIDGLLGAGRPSWVSRPVRGLDRQVTGQDVAADPVKGLVRRYGSSRRVWDQVVLASSPICGIGGMSWFVPYAAHGI